MFRILMILPALMVAMMLSSGVVRAEEDAARGPVTNLPIPRYVSMKASEANIRRGPGLTHRIDWVFQHRGMPLRITAEFSNWRRVEDQDGVGGWVHYSLLSGTRTVRVLEPLVTMYSSASDSVRANAQIEGGAIARLMECEPDWCRISADGYRGWVRKDVIWGVAADEIRE